MKFKKNSVIPYTGKFKKNYATSQLNQEFYYKNGKVEGVAKGYYDTGKLRKEENYKDGELLKTENKKD